MTRGHGGPNDVNMKEIAALTKEVHEMSFVRKKF